jgi:RNA polymerase sigma factor (sigma-70 family)
VSSPQFEHFLCKRAAAGDVQAFEQLLTANATKLRSVARSFAEQGAEVDDCFQIGMLKLVTEIQRGHFDPNRGGFVPFASTVFHQALRDDRQRRRAQKRWAPEPPASMEVLIELDLEPQSFSLGCDPLTIVIQRETLRETIQALTRGQLQAVNSYLLSGGCNEPPTMVTAFCDARKRARPYLAAMNGSSLRLV